MICESYNWKIKNAKSSTAKVRSVCHCAPDHSLLPYRYLLLDRRLPGRSMAVVLKKLLVDQLLFSPLCLTVFFLSLGVFQGGGVNEIVSDVQQKGWRLYVAECLVWPPAQLVNFYLLPTKFRVLYDNSISLMFDIYTSHVCYDRETSEDE